jgi:hypothetical protein
MRRPLHLQGITEELLEEIEDEKLTADGQIDQSDFILFFLVKTGKISRCGAGPLRDQT